MIIRLSPTAKNATPAVVAAIEELKRAGGGELHLDAGEYHFYRDGSVKRFFAVSNNSACDKYIAFPIIDAHDIVVDAHGAALVFHEVLFPFMISGSRNITVKNMLIDTGRSPLVEFKIHGRTDEGFYMDIDRERDPFSVKDGAIVFHRECEDVSGINEYFSLHAIDRHKVNYLATGDCRANLNNLPAPLLRTDAIEVEGGIYVKYRDYTPAKCGFGDERVSAIIDGKRNVDVICLDRSEGVSITDVTVARGIGMGVIAQLSRDILIDGLRTAHDYHGASHQTLSADAMHFVNCDGTLEIRNCSITRTMDDVINVHGIYTELTDICDDGIRVALKHREQLYFNPYREGDRLVIVDGESLDELAEFTVSAARFADGGGSSIALSGAFTYGKEHIRCGMLVENPDRMPDLHMHHNTFESFPHVRLSGAGKMLIENNRFADCSGALVCLDLARFWYESGRVSELIYRDNELEGCNKGNAFITVGIDGVASELAPKIHRRVVISGNRFKRIERPLIDVGGVRELIIEGNEIAEGESGIIILDGEKREL